MGSFVVNTKTVRELAPGQTGHWKWNNAAPHNAVWSANAVPESSGDDSKGFTEDVSFEVTRLWRRFIVTEDQTGDLKIEHEIHYEVKNVGNQTGKFTVYLAADF